MTSDREADIELGMKVAVRHGVREDVGVVVRLEGEYVTVCWTWTDWNDPPEYRAHRNDVRPLLGWI